MAYCRFSGDCRVYMYPSIYGGYQFHLSGPSPNGYDLDFNVETKEQALEKLEGLYNAGMGVPIHALDRLRMEIAGEDNNSE